MQVYTHTERLVKYRRMILEMLFTEANHVYAVCVSNGFCELQALAQVLYGPAPTGEILTIAGADFVYGEMLSQAVLDRLPEVRHYIAAFLNGANAAESQTNDSPNMDTG